MSMSSYVYGIVPPDATWKKMKGAWDACKAVGVTPPKEVVSFFGGDAPDEKGVLVDLKKSGAVAEYSTNMEEGFEVDLTKLPTSIKILRFVNSY